MRKSSAVNQPVLERTHTAPPVEVIVVLSSQDRVTLTELERVAGKLDFLPLVINGEGPEPNYRWTVKLADGEEGGFGPFLDPSTKPAFTKREPLFPLTPAEVEEPIVDVKSFSKRATRAEVPEPYILEFDIDLTIEVLYDDKKAPKKVVLLEAPPTGIAMTHPRDRREKVRIRPIFKIVGISAIEQFEGGGGDEGEAQPEGELQEEEEPEG
jgi:hypothetical protein